MTFISCPLISLGATENKPSQGLALAVLFNEQLGLFFIYLLILVANRTTWLFTNESNG